jgi:hypothetical protein
MKNRYVAGFVGLYNPTRDSLLVEKHRLVHGMSEKEIAQGSLVESYFLSCNDAAQEVLDRGHDVMVNVTEAGLKDGWPGLDHFQNKLPAWFVSACRPEDEDKESQEESFTLAGWLHWMQPSHRIWLWLNADIINKNTLLLDVDRMGDFGNDGIFPFGLEWLFKTAGATEIEVVMGRDQNVQLRET